MPDSTPCFVGGSFEEKLLKLKIYSHAFKSTSQSDSAEGKEANLLLNSAGVY